MRKYIILMLISGIICINGKAQDYVNEIKVEINDHYNKIDSLLIIKNYYVACQEAEMIQYNLKMLYGIFLDSVLCPKQLNEFYLDENSRSNEMDGEKITLIREYARLNKDMTLNRDCLLTLEISNNDLIIEKIANINAFLFDLIDEMDRKYKPVEISNYKALLVYDRNKKMSSIAVALSNKITVRITLIGSDDLNLLINSTQLINYKRIVELLPPNM